MINFKILLVQLYKSVASVQDRNPPPAMDLHKILSDSKIIDDYEMATDVDEENVDEKVHPSLTSFNYVFAYYFSLPNVTS